MARFTAPASAAVLPGGVVNAPPARVTRPAVTGGARMPSGHADIAREAKK